MKRQFRQNALKSAFVIFCLGFAIPAFSIDVKGNSEKVPNELDGVGVSEHLGQSIDLTHLFTSVEDQKEHALSDFFQTGKPIVLNMVYFECPMLCTMVLNGITDGMKKLNWSVGKEFNVITISINPKDDAETGTEKRKNYLDHYFEGSREYKMNRDEMAVSQGWQFFTGKEDQIKALANELGFEYKYDSLQKQYAHAAVTFILTPDGKISRYLYGVQYNPNDLKLALLEASRGKIGNVFDRLLMFCYHYDPSLRGYALQATRIMQAGGVAIIAFLGGYLAVFWTRQRKGKKQNDKVL